jgi:Domain of unknown function (DUF4416)
MAKPRQAEPGLLVSALFSRHLDALIIGRTQLERHFGPVAFSSLIYHFNQTTYYERAMGPGLRKHFLAFDTLLKPDCLADAKLLAIDMEHACAQSGQFPERRPLNIDPGLLTLGKFVLATTKDQAHRIYLGQGIFCEVTLRFEHGSYVPWPWTYADYRQPAVLEFMKQARTFYRQRLAAQDHPADDAANNQVRVVAKKPADDPGEA